MDHLIWQCVVGLICGIIAKILMPGKDGGGCISTMVLGLLGSALFGYLVRTFFPQLGVLGHWGGAIFGSIIILILWRLIFGSSK